ncbi:MAG: hypothetical protein SH847_22945 [Roseiflexaceae bacterium]|nr:hypothetical protein [Roseiflexaceae bacterium]
MSQPKESNGLAALTPEDLVLLGLVTHGNDWLRAVLCTLARRGVAFRQQGTARAEALLAALAPLPLYKGGQFLFDLLEWEDFMLDGAEPPIVPTTLDAQALNRIAGALQSLRSALDGAPLTELFPTLSALPATDEQLPPLEPGFYLYQDVVLGVVRSVLPYLQAVQL